MKSLTPTDIYWITLIGIALCFLAIGYICGFVRGRNNGWETGYGECMMDYDLEGVRTEYERDFKDDILDVEILEVQS